jgi:hypothetical protein
VEDRRPTPIAVRCLSAIIGLAAASYASYVGITWLRYGHVAPSVGDEIDSLLDRFMPTYEMRERHQTQVAAPADLTFVAASEMDIQRVPLVRALFKGRALFLGGKVDEAERPRTLLAWMKSLGWTVLADVPGRQVVVGTVMRPWEPDPTPRVVTPEEFAVFCEPEYVKIVSTWAAESVGPNQARFTIATPVAATDATATRLFRRYWSLFSPGSLLIRCMGLRLVRGEVEGHT